MGNTSRAMKTFPSCGMAFRSLTGSGTPISQLSDIEERCGCWRRFSMRLMDRQDREAPEENFELVM